MLVDSDAVIRRLWRQWARQRDVPFREIEAIYHGRPMIEVIEEVAPHLDAEAEVDRVTHEIATALQGLTAFDGAESLLAELPDDRWAIATSARRRTATSRLAHVGLPIPETLVTADDVEHGKPDPEPYLLAAERLGVAPRRCLVFEDAPAGIVAAREAGAEVIAVATTNPPRTLAAADAVVRDLRDIEIERTENGAFRTGLMSKSLHG